MDPIKEEDDGASRNTGSSFRRRIFARSRTNQLTLSIPSSEVQTTSLGSSQKSLKSSNQSLSSWKKQVSFDDSLSEFALDQKHTKVMQSKSGKVLPYQPIISGDFSIFFRSQQSFQILGTLHQGESLDRVFLQLQDPPSQATCQG